MAEINKKFNVLKDRDLRASVRRIQAHGIMVVGSFMIGLDVDTPGIGDRIAAAADWYGVDNMNVLFFTPLPGTRLWDQMKAQHRIALDTFPADWQYYTLTYPVARHHTLSLSEIIAEMITCNRTYYSIPNIFWRMVTGLIQGRGPFYGVIANFSSRRNARAYARRYAGFEALEGWRFSRSGGTGGPHGAQDLLRGLAR